MESVTKTPTPAASTGAPTAPATTASAPTSLPPTVIFKTPALTTTFKPPPGCVKQHLTMLEADAYKVWMNEILPVPNTTFTSCYPDEFATSYLQSKSNTIAPAFSPLVCPENYNTVFNQTMSDRPLYVACCPTSFGFSPPETSSDGRPAYGGTCYSDILSTTITQYDNSSSSGVMLFSTMGQAYAHPIDGFALHAEASATADVTLADGTDTAAFTGAFIATGAVATASSTPTTTPSSSSSSSTSPGVIAGSVLGAVAFLLLLLALFLFWRRGQNLKAQLERRTHQEYLSNTNPNPKTYAQHQTWPSDEKHLPPTPPYQRHWAGAKVSEIQDSGMAWVQELPGVHAAPQELAAYGSPRTTVAGGSSSAKGLGIAAPHIVTAARSRESLEDRDMLESPPPGSPPRAYRPGRSQSVRSDDWPQPPGGSGGPFQNPFASPGSPGGRRGGSEGRRTPARGMSQDDVMSPLSSEASRGAGRGRGSGRSDGMGTLSPLSPEAGEEQRRRLGW